MATIKELEAQMADLLARAQSPAGVSGTAKETQGQRVQRWIDTLYQTRREYLPKAAAAQAEWQNNKVYSDAYKKARISEAEAALQADAYDKARVAWAVTNEAESKAAKQLQEAAAAGERNWDYGKLAFLAGEYGATLGKLQKGDGVFPLESTIEQIGRLRQDAVERGDAHRLRALRQAGLAILTGQHDSKANGLRRLFAEDEANENPAAVQAAKDLEQVRSLRPTVRREILSLEREVYPNNGASIFEPLSRWQKDILGETYQDLGGGVHLPAGIDPNEPIAKGG